MINQKIVEYIQQNLDEGYDVAAIRKRLIAHGYPQNDIDDTINHVQQQSTASQETTNDSNSKFARFRAKFSPGFVVAILILAAITAGLSFLIISNNSNNLAPSQNTDGQMPTGKSAADIYEDGNFTAEKLDVDGQIRQDNGVVSNESEEVLEASNETLDVAEAGENLSEQQPETAINETPIIEQPKEAEEFKFSPGSIVSTQNNISLSLDDIKHEIKSEYWGKIIEITSTVLNNGYTPFKPKLLVLLYDEKDFKEEWLKPKAEIQFDIEPLKAGEHATRQAIVSISFDDITLTKNFKLILVDAADPGNKPLVVVETDFNPIS